MKTALPKRAVLEPIHEKAAHSSAGQDSSSGRDGRHGDLGRWRHGGLLTCVVVILGVALNAVEFELIAGLLQNVRKAGLSRRPRVLCLGYPDALVDRETWYGPTAWDDLPKRSDVAQIWTEHGYSERSGEPMVDARGAIELMDAEVTICDAIQLEVGTVPLDLNLPLPRKWRGAFDLVIDPGTIEHCFEIAQALKNVAAMVRVGGWIYHQAVISYPNHGFWSISPTAFVDFYERNGFISGQPYRFGTGDHPFRPALIPVDRFKPFIADGALIGSYLFVRTHGASMLNPLQRCYVSGPKWTSDFHADFLTRPRWQ
jgi:hypothetical protein